MEDVMHKVQLNQCHVQKRLLELLALQMQSTQAQFNQLPALVSSVPSVKRSADAMQSKVTSSSQRGTLTKRQRTSLEERLHNWQTACQETIKDLALLTTHVSQSGAGPSHQCDQAAISNRQAC